MIVPMAGPVVVLEQVTKAYRRGGDRVRAVDCIDLAVMPASLVAIVGPSGSGKSSLLHLMGGLDRPTSGRVLLDGHDLAALRDSELTLLRRRRVGFVFQFFNLLPRLSTWQNIALPLLLDGIEPEAARRTAAMLARHLRIGHRLDAPAGELSGGEMQRAAVARALVHEPAIILADEPTGNLDQRTGGELLQLLRDLVYDDGVCIVMVTHDPAAAGIADRVVDIVDGRIVADAAMSAV